MGQTGMKKWGKERNEKNEMRQGRKSDTERNEAKKGRKE